MPHTAPTKANAATLIVALCDLGATRLSTEGPTANQVIAGLDAISHRRAFIPDDEGAATDSAPPNDPKHPWTDTQILRFAKLRRNLEKKLLEVSGNEAQVIQAAEFIQALIDGRLAWTPRKADLPPATITWLRAIGITEIAQIADFTRSGLTWLMGQHKAPWSSTVQTQMVNRIEVELELLNLDFAPNCRGVPLALLRRQWFGDKWALLAGGVTPVAIMPHVPGRTLGDIIDAGKSNLKMHLDPTFGPHYTDSAVNEVVRILLFLGLEFTPEQEQ